MRGFIPSPRVRGPFKAIERAPAKTAVAQNDGAVDVAMGHERVAELVHQLEELVQKAKGIVTDAEKKAAERIGAIKLEHKGDPGTPGADAQIDYETIAQMVVPRIKVPEVKAPVVDEAKIAKQAAKLIKVPKAKDGDPGKDAKPEAVAAVITGMLKEGTLKINAEHVEGLDQKLAPIHDLERRHNSIRGGGDTVAAGTNVTITRLPSGQAQINATGAGLTPITVTGTVDDSNKSFTAATQPTLLNINGAFYLKTGGAYTWTYVGTTITLNQPVGTGGSIFGI